MSVQAVFFSLLPHSLIELFHTSTCILNLSLFLVWFIFLTYDVCIIYIIQVSDHLALWWNASTPQVTQVSAQAHFGLSLYKGPINKVFFLGRYQSLLIKETVYQYFCHSYLHAEYKYYTARKRHHFFFCTKLIFQSFRNVNEGINQSCCAKGMSLHSLWECRTFDCLRLSAPCIVWQRTQTYEESMTKVKWDEWPLCCNCCCYIHLRSPQIHKITLIKTVIFPSKIWSWSTATSIGALVWNFGVLL